MSERDPASPPCQAPPGYWGEDTPPPGCAGLVSLNLLVLKTRQLEPMRAFYERLGIAFAREQHGDGPVHYAGRAGGVVLEIYPASDNGDTGTRLGFSVAALQRVVDSLAASGARVQTPPQASAWGLRAVVRDPDGRAVELYERRREPPGG
jgi:predicted enzyme related to lactoylglutathione lyase